MQLLKKLLVACCVALFAPWMFSYKGAFKRNSFWRSYSSRIQ